MTPPASNLAKLHWFATYMFASVGMVIFNKHVMHVLPAPNLLLVFQNAVTVLLLLLAVRTGKFHMKPWSTQHLWQATPITICFVLMLLTSLYGLQLVAVPTVVVARNFGSILVATGDYAVFKRRFGEGELVGLTTVCCGALLYGQHDLYYDASGYFWVLANMLAVVVAALVEKSVVSNMDQTPTGISCYQNLLSIPVLLVIGIAQGEPSVVTNGLSLLDGPTASMLALSSILGFILSLTYFSLNKIASATSISLAGNMNKFVSVIVGAFVFHQDMSLQSAVGLIICLFGGFYYSYESIQAKQVAKQDKADGEVA